MCANVDTAYGIGEFSRIVGISVKTLQRWDRLGILKPFRSPTNRRLYTVEHLKKILSTQESKNAGNTGDKDMSKMQTRKAT